jgi:hypothetical protein
MAAVLRRSLVGGGTGEVASSGALTAARAGGAGDSAGETSTGAEGSAAAGSAALMRAATQSEVRKCCLPIRCAQGNSSAKLSSCQFVDLLGPLV